MGYINIVVQFTKIREEEKKLYTGKKKLSIENQGIEFFLKVYKLICMQKKTNLIYIFLINFFLVADKNLTLN